MKRFVPAGLFAALVPFLAAGAVSAAPLAAGEPLPRSPAPDPLPVGAPDERAVPLGAASRPSDPYDLVFRNARVLDGTGTPWFRADVAVRGDRIAAVGRLEGARAEREVDASGLYLAPGFIDTHSHAAGGLSDPELSTAEPLLAQGVTTVFVNPDGGGMWDLSAQRDSLERDGLGVNVARFVPHGSIRREVVGLDDRRATSRELERMREKVRAGMEEGAYGLSSGLFYAPGSYAPLEEVIELARVTAEYGGAYQSHIRDEADYTIGVVAAVDEVIRVAEEAGIPGVVTHVKALGPRVWGFSDAIVHRIDRARGRGVEVFADQYPYEASATGLSAALVPRWATDGGTERFRERMDDPEVRPRLVEEMHDNLDRRGGAHRIQFRRYEADASIEGRTLEEVADSMGMGPVEASLELLRHGGPSIVSFNMHHRDVARLMAQPWTMTASDGGLVSMGEGTPHPRNYGSFPRKLRKYVVEDEVVDLAFAIRSMTGMPASVYRMPERGLVRTGMNADLVVFDLERLRDRATYTDPHQLSEGVEYVLVNGELAVDEGAFTGSLSGRVLHRADPEP